MPEINLNYRKVSQMLSAIMAYERLFDCRASADFCACLKHIIHGQEADIIKSDACQELINKVAHLKLIGETTKISAYEGKIDLTLNMKLTSCLSQNVDPEWLDPRVAAVVTNVEHKGQDLYLREMCSSINRSIFGKTIHAGLPAICPPFSLDIIQNEVYTEFVKTIDSLTYLAHKLDKKHPDLKRMNLFKEWCFQSY